MHGPMNVKFVVSIFCYRQPALFLIQSVLTLTVNTSVDQYTFNCHLLYIAAVFRHNQVEFIYIKFKVMRWAGHVARMGEERGCIGSWWGNWRETDHWGDLGVDGWIILGWISRRWDVGIWTGFGWPIRPRYSLCENYI